MTEFIKTIVSAIQTWVKGLIKESTADWNQNDAEAENYVKNRTHYEEVNEVVLVDNLTFADYDNGNYPKCNFIIGQSYNVVWNGTLYENLICFTDGEFNIIASQDDGYPFYIDDDGGNSLYIESENSDWVVSIFTTHTVIHKLDAKYLPDEISPQSDWNQNDSTQADYIKNRPFGEFNDKILDEKWFINNDGHPEPFPPSLENLFEALKNYVIVLDGTEYYAQAYDSDVDGTGVDLPDTKYGYVSLYNRDYVWFENLRNKEVDIKIYEHYTKTIDPKFETDPTVPDWAKKPNKPTYTPDELGAMAKANPVGTGSFSMNRKAGTTVGENSHTEGTNTSAIGSSSHAEGDGSNAKGSYSHAEGLRTNANGSGSHTEGYQSSADGNYSHAEGYYTSASGSNSHAEGYYTSASGSNQHVQGKYNTYDLENKYAHIVGNGTGSTTNERSNAHTLDWNGNA